MPEFKMFPMFNTVQGEPPHPWNFGGVEPNGEAEIENHGGVAGPKFAPRKLNHICRPLGIKTASFVVQLLILAVTPALPSE